MSTREGHAVTFYEHDDELAESVGGYLARGLSCGEGAIVVATAQHRGAFAAALGAHGFDLAALEREGRFVALDASETLMRMQTGGRIDGGAFDRVIGGLLRDATRERPVRVYGEMVALLWAAGDVLGAIEFETHWNDLREALDFSLCCAYPAPAHADPGTEDGLRRICELHTSTHHGPHRGSRSAEAIAVFPADPVSPAAARRWLRSVLASWTYDSASVDDALLVLTELVTNAIVHARSSISVRVNAAASRLQIVVGDGGTDGPTRRPLAPALESGRGLYIIGAIADAWGVDATAAGKAVWADLPMLQA